MWRSMLDEFNETGRIPEGFEVVSRKGDVPHVRCGCRRVVPADMMMLTETGYACDGCVSRMRRKRGIGRREMAEHLGGPREESPCCTRSYAGGRTALDVSDDGD